MSGGEVLLMVDVYCPLGSAWPFVPLDPSLPWDFGFKRNYTCKELELFNGAKKVLRFVWTFSHCLMLRINSRESRTDMFPRTSLLDNLIMAVPKYEQDWSSQEGQVFLKNWSASQNI